MSKMIGTVEIREGVASDLGGIEQLYVGAFPDEKLFPLVRELLDLEKRVISLVGIIDNAIIGHICFTICGVEGEKDKVALLAPLAVSPVLQKQGIGRALVLAGFDQVEKSKIGYVVVLGDPGFYSRFGFKTEDKVTTPYPIPSDWRDAWQSIMLCDAEAPLKGKLSVPEPWRKIALWTF